MERMDSREQKIKEMIEERKQQLAEHESGRTLLDTEVNTHRNQLTSTIYLFQLYLNFVMQNHARVKRQIVNFGRKLEQMQGMSAQVSLYAFV